VREHLDELRARLAPDPRPSPDPGDRLAAVLALVILEPDPALLFTERARDLRRHPGEVSFPGGLVEAHDVDLLTTALRETEEEIGLRRDDVEVLGALPPVHTFVSGILVTPFVGTVPALPTLRVSDGEIIRVLTPSLAALDAAEQERVYRRPGGDGPDRSWTGWAYEVDGATIWGATGRMLHTLLELLRKETTWLIRR
jgi:8-oxo-dGTP pyrophosphatase MutT (NUDIX family)